MKNDKRQLSCINAHRNGKIRAWCSITDRVDFDSVNEASVKDAVLKAYDKATRHMPDNEARVYARQLSKAFQLVGSIDDQTDEDDMSALRSASHGV